MAVAADPGDMLCTRAAAQLVDGNWLSALTMRAVASGMREGHWYWAARMIARYASYSRGRTPGAINVIYS